VALIVFLSAGHPETHHLIVVALLGLCLIASVANLLVWRVNESAREETAEAHRRARESEELYRRSFDEAASGVVVSSLDGRVLRANRAFCALTGYCEDDLAGRRFNDFTHPDDRGADTTDMRRLIDGEIDSLQQRKRYVRPGGEAIWVDLQCAVVRDDDGTPLYMTAQAQDITARKKAEDALQASETRYRALVDHLPDTIVATYDRDLRCQFVGGSMRADGTTSHEDVLGRTLHETLPAEQADDWAARFRAAFAGLPNEFVTSSANGREFEAQIVPLADETGAITSALSVTRDVTDRRAAQEALRESQERLQAILDYAPAVIHLKDADGRFVLANHGMQDLLGVSFEQIRGRTDYDFFPAALAEELRAQDVQVRETELPIAREFELEVGGKPRTYFDIKFPVFDARGVVTGVCAIATDITARKSAEVGLRISEQRHRSVVDALDEGVLLYDSHGTVIACNQSAAEMIGREPAEIVGCGAEDLPLRLVREDGTEFERDDRPGYKAILTGEPQLGIVAGHPRPDGTMAWLSVNAIPIVDDSAGAPYAVATSFADITERRRAERLKEEFFALVSHELRTPLTSITGYLELLLDEGGDLDGEQRHFLGVVERNARRLQRLVGDLLFVAQFEAGKLSLDVGRVRLTEVAAEAVESAAPRAAELGLDLRLNAEETPETGGDSGRIGQTLDNLISNALKFTPSGGRVDVRVLNRRDHVVIEVADTGLGISRNEQQRLFDRFYRTATATEQAIPGVGLGLSISKAIVEGHGGSITVASDEGRGTTFTITLPLTGAQRPPAGRERATRARHSA
jgi:PAS domain S-box-containing protein